MYPLFFSLGGDGAILSIHQTRNRPLVRLGPLVSSFEHAVSFGKLERRG